MPHTPRVSRHWHKHAGPGGSNAWEKLRTQVLERNRQTNAGRCTLAVPRVCTKMATVVHHQLGRAVTGDDPRYLMAVCAPCNHHVGDPMRQADPPARPVTRW